MEEGVCDEGQCEEKGEEEGVCQRRWDRVCEERV